MQNKYKQFFAEVFETIDDISNMVDGLNGLLSTLETDIYDAAKGTPYEGLLTMQCQRFKLVLVDQQLKQTNVSIHGEPPAVINMTDDVQKSPEEMEEPLPITEPISFSNAVVASIATIDYEEGMIFVQVSYTVHPIFRCEMDIMGLSIGQLVNVDMETGAVISPAQVSESA